MTTDPPPGLTPPGLIRRMTTAAVQADRAMQYGKALGLTAEEARETLGAWIEYRIAAGWTWDPERVHRSMEARADGRPWEPERL